MTIKILPPQLANQIAAGEVVERPASVVKELVENALDAGANKIEIEIEKGGHKRILVRDNGKGIDKEQLTLALSRHATSKISDIDDLEAIVSLGFRGEALASISSVARLTMTSKPAQQKEAWSAIAEGLDMDVTVKPAAHPNGTSVDVLDLFFNTPARRKFLRAEKTEFGHIDTLIKRIALSRADTTFVLKHNGKVVKRYRGLATESDEIKRVSHRISEVINPKFVEQSSAHSVIYDQVSIRSWVKQPEACVTVNPAQYAFVNGRMMRDKLIQHAIRQAFAGSLHPEQQPEYVLFIDLPAEDVDVNVHPAKHEVRFHYARLLHDLVVRTVQETLASFGQSQLAEATATDEAPDWLVTPQQNTVSESQVTQIEKSALKPKYEMQETPVNRFPGLKPVAKADKFGRDKVTARQMDAFAQYASTAAQDYGSDLPSTQALTAHTPTTKSASSEPHSAPQLETIPQSQNEPVEQVPSKSKTMQLVLLQEGRYAFIRQQQKMYLLDLARLSSEKTVEVNEPELWQTAPLLVPIRLKLTAEELEWCRLVEPVFIQAGFEIKLHSPYLIVKQVPNLLRRGNASQALPEKLSALMLTPELTLAQLQAKLAPQSNVNVTEDELHLLLKDPDKLKQLVIHLQELKPEQLL